MANTFSTEANGFLNSTPVSLASGAVVGGNLRRHRATITLASQASGDTITLTRLPPGSAFAFGMLSASVSLGTATIAIGIAGNAGKYRADAVHTATVPTTFGVATTVDDAPLADAETVILTISTAALPSSGTLVVDFYTSGT